MPSASDALVDRFVDDRDGHLDPLVRQVVLAARRTHDLVRHLHPPDDLPEDRVLTVEEVGILDHDEELRAGAVRIVGSCHGHDPAAMGLGVELRLQLVARAAHAVLALLVGILRVGISSLDHESRYDTVKERLVVESGLGERDEILHDKTDRKSTRLNSSHLVISYAVFCLKKKKKAKNVNMC